GGLRARSGGDCRACGARASRAIGERAWSSAPTRRPTRSPPASSGRCSGFADVAQHPRCACKCDPLAQACSIRLWFACPRAASRDKTPKRSSPMAQAGQRATEKRKPIALHVAVPTEDESYPVLIGPGLLARLGHELRRSHASARRVALISDEHVMPLYGPTARASLEAEDLEVHSFTIPAGERSKSVEQLLRLVEGMVAANMGRRDVVVALGGGVVGDLAGLAA